MGLCGWFEGYGLAEASEFGDETVDSLLCFVAAGEVVLAEFVVFGVLGEDVPDDHDHGVRDSEDGLGFGS